MGYTRARRYANYKGGKKYSKGADYQLFEPGIVEAEEAEAAEISYRVWKTAEADGRYAIHR